MKCTVCFNQTDVAVSMTKLVSFIPRMKVILRKLSKLHSIPNPDVNTKHFRRCKGKFNIIGTLWLYKYRQN